MKSEGKRGRRSTTTAGVHVAYIMSRFPKITETFVLHEILAVRRMGIDVRIYPLLRERAEVVHPEVNELLDQARFHPLTSWRTWWSNLTTLTRQPRTYLGTFFRVIKETFGSINFLVGALGTFPKAVAMSATMQDEGITHVHAHFANHPALVAYVIHRMSGIPFTFTAHGSDIHVDQTALALKIDAAKQAVMISEYNREFVARRCGEQVRPKLEVIHCGIDPELFQRSEPRQGTQFVILCVAALRSVKGHRFLLEACAHLVAEGIDFHCHLIGEGPLRESLQSQIRGWQIEDRVTLHGAQPRPQVLRHMLRADVVVLPSVQDRAGRREGIPVTLMEAMSCETAVVASRISGIPELVEDGVSGVLVTPGDGRALAEVLAKLANDRSLIETLGVNGRLAVLRDFKLDDSVTQLVRLFKPA